MRNYPGYICNYFSDGSLVSIIEDDLVFFDAKVAVTNRLKNIYPHHMINLNAAGDLLVIGSSIELIKKTKIRMDTLLVVNRNSTIVKKLNFKDHMKDIIANTILTAPVDTFFHTTAESKNAVSEFLHVNSFYEIPAQKEPALNPYFVAGNYIVNTTNSSHLFIIDKNLSKIVQFLPKAKVLLVYDIPVLHDVYPTTDGRIISYMNLSKISSPNLSQIWIHDSLFSNLLFSYKRESRPVFYSDHTGGVQFFQDESFVFSEMVDGKPQVTHVKKNGELIHKIPLKLPKKYDGIMQIKADDLTSFLSKNKGF